MTLDDRFLTLIITGLVFLPLAAALICYLMQSLRAAQFISMAVGGLCLIATVLLASHIFTSDNIIEIYLGGWQVPLGIRLTVDGIRAVLLAMTAIIVLVISTYAASYFKDKQLQLRFWPLWWLLVTGLYGMFLSGDIFNIYIMLELIGISAVCLIALNNSQASLNAAYQYLLVGLFGSLCYLLGVALLYRVYGTLDIAQLSGLISNTVLTNLAMAFCTIGMLLKCAIYPLHFWLPAAHSNAYAPVSAILSALVVKAAFFVLVVFWMQLSLGVTSNMGLYLLGGMGAVAVLYGSFKAFTSPKLKLLIAYSTVAQIGYLFLAFPLVQSSPQQVKTAVLYFIVAHGCAKAAMFMSAGTVQKALGHDNLAELKGIVTRFPLSVFIFAIASASLIGLPPTGGFVAKWLLITSAVEQQQWWLVAVLFLGGLLASAYLFRVLNLAFTSPDKEANLVVEKESKMLSSVGLALITIVIGLNALWLTDILADVT